MTEQILNCDLCGTPLRIRVGETEMSFVAHDRAFCAATIGGNFSTLMAQIRRTETEINQLRQAWKAQKPLMVAITELAVAAAEWLRRGGADPAMQRAMERLEDLRGGRACAWCRAVESADVKLAPMLGGETGPVACADVVACRNRIDAARGKSDRFPGGPG